MVEILRNVAWIGGALIAVVGALKLRDYFDIPMALFGCGGLTLLFGVILLIRFRQFHPFMRNTVVLVTLGLFSLSAALAVNEYVTAFFQMSSAYLILAILPGFSYMGWRSYTHPNGQPRHLTNRSSDDGPEGPRP